MKLKTHVELIAVELLNSRIATMQEHFRREVDRYSGNLYSQEDLQDYVKAVKFLIKHGYKYDLKEAKAYLNLHES